VCSRAPLENIIPGLLMRATEEGKNRKISCRTAGSIGFRGEKTGDLSRTKGGEIGKRKIKPHNTGFGEVT